MATTKQSKELQLGKFRPLAPNTSLAKICTAALPGKMTVEQIATAVGLRADQVQDRLRHGLGVGHGIGHSRDEQGVVRIVLPDGVPVEMLIAAAAVLASASVAETKVAKPGRRTNVD